MNSSNKDGNLNILGPSSYYNSIGNVYEGKAPLIFNMGIFPGSGRYKFPVPDKYFVYILRIQKLLSDLLLPPAQSIETSVDMTAMNAGFFPIP